ncbi:MAG: hypothetical protein Q9220_002112 [cf. Caloplaca sp. 1 TL-2023]
MYSKSRAQENLPDILVKEDDPSQSRPAKKRHTSNPVQPPARTPQKKRSKNVHPQQNEATRSEDPDSQSVHNTPIAAHRISIGPTPQRNGRVLGLFDLLTPSSTFRTPSRSRQALVPLSPNVAATPSQVAEAKTYQDKEHGVQPICSSLRKRSRSPPSASKRTYLDSFLTPLSRRFVDNGNRTPEGASQVSTLRFENTPAFLRRDSQGLAQSQKAGTMNNEEEEGALSWSPIAVRVIRPKPAGRGLSALVKGLRALEEEKLDEDLEMLRDMEGGGGGGDRLGNQTKDSAARVCVEDSQVPDMPLGPDGGGDSESEDMEALKAEGKDRNGRPLKVWKKKGQKRTTRRVKIKPNTAKWKPEPEWKGEKEDESEGEVIAVEETQLVAQVEHAEAGSEGDDVQTDEDYASEGADVEDMEKSNRVKHAKGSEKAGAPTVAQNAKKKKPVNALAHTNFRALKIRNKNSKGKGRGRFGRRR